MALPATISKVKHVRRSLSAAKAKTDERRPAANQIDSDREHPHRDDGAERREAGDGPAGRVGGIVFGGRVRRFGSYHRAFPVHDLAPGRPCRAVNAAPSDLFPAPPQPRQ